MTYDEIVNRTNIALRNRGAYSQDFGPFGYREGDSVNVLDLTEVNAWTYWQGVNVCHPKVLVVGQDWGCLEEGKESAIYKTIKEMIDSPSSDNTVQYFKYVKNKAAITDINLVRCLSCLGYDDVDHIRYQDLFFTNLIPGYRRGTTSSGGFSSKWLTKQAKQDFRDLVEVLEPELVICLGKDTFRQACMIFERKNALKGKKWKEFLEEQVEPIEVLSPSGRTISIFASSHPGFYGTNNRGGIEKVFEDWNRIRAWMDSALVK